MNAIEIPGYVSGSAARWRPFTRGPRDQWLKCEGSLAARTVSWMHFHWPLRRGQWRFMQIVARLPGLKESLSDVVFRSASGVVLRVDVPSDRFLFLSGRLPPEPVEIALVTRLVRPGDVFLDVGAHWGLYVLHVLGLVGKAGKYYAIEPSPRSACFLATAYPGNEGVLEVVEAAISDFDGEGMLAGSGEVTDHLAKAGADGGAKVRVMRIDTLLKGVRPAQRVFIKADTEGQEAAVVRGCAGLAAAGIKPIFLLEFLREIHGQTRADVVNAIESTFGACYDFWAIDSESGQMVAFRDAAEVVGEVRNMIAVPRP